MTRINTNVSSLVAQHTLGRNNAALQQSLTRLSTGLRINSGKDDPAGLIASESFRLDITAVNKAITNSERAGQVIATADSALGQVSSLLNDVRGLVSEAANTGALSDEQIAANQLQVDSSLEAIDRIAQVTTFQGRRLLDGSLGFLVSEGAGFSTVSDINIEQANLGTSGSINVNVDISAAASLAQVTNTLPASATGQFNLDGQAFTLQTAAGQNLSSVSVNLDVNADASATNRFTIDGHEFEAIATGTTDDDIIVAVSTNDTTAFDHGARADIVFDQSTVSIHADAATNFDNTTVSVTKSALGATADSSNIVITDNTGGGGNDITLDISATANGAAAGDDPITVAVATAAAATSADYNSTTNTLTITLDTTDNSITAAELDAAIEGATLDTAAAGTPLFTVTSADADTIDGTGGGPFGLTGASDTTLTREEVLATYTAGTNTLALTLNSDLTNVTTAQIKAAIDALTEFNDGTTSVSGPSNVATANVTASATYGTLVRPTTLASYTDTSSSSNIILTDSTDDITLSITATAAGAASNDRPITVAVTSAAAATSADYDSTTDTLTITLDTTDNSITAAELTAAIDGATLDGAAAATALFTSTSADADTLDGTGGGPFGLDGASDTTLTGGNTLTIDFDDQNGAIDYADVISAIDSLTEFSGTTTTSTSGTINGVTLTDNATLSTLSRLTTGAAAFFNTTNDTLTLTVDGTNAAITNTNILAAINALTQFDGSTTTNAGGIVDGTSLTSTNGLATAAQVQDLVVRVSGELGSEVFAFQAGTTFSQIADAIQLVSDATGVTATTVGSQLTLTSSKYGSNAFVGVEVISEGTGGTFESNLSAKRATGTDVVARINGIQANGDGNSLSLNTATLDLSLTVADGSGTDVAFTINGGGAIFQLGPGVVSNQQARIGIESVSASELGGVSGRLYELRSGEAKSLSTDPTNASRIVEEAATKVTQLRGRLGAFQRTTLESNINSLQDTLTNLTDAQSSIRDADFAEETAALTRAQILVQSGTSVLAIANQNPQNVLALLG